MRPVNLIPPEDRRGEKAPLRTGPMPYAVVGLLAFALIAVSLIVVTNNQISDREAEKASLEDQVSEAQAEATKLESFVNFAALEDARQQTVNSLATSRFDWERVLRELAIVIPSDVWLTNLDAQASAASGSSTSSTGTSSSNEDIQGPSLDIQGCAAGHDAVARFLAAVREVDGVTRATVMSSDSSSDSSGGSTSGGTGTAGGLSCASRDFIVSFEILVAFDGAQPEATTEAAPSTTAPAPDSTAASASQPSSSSSSAGTEQAQRGTGGQTNDGGAFVAGAGSTP
jgi:Tfp pilus assembly protein PilN